MDWKEKWPERVSPSGIMKQSLSLEQKREVYIYRACQVHDNKYTYENLSYVNAKTKVIITCPVHGDFEQSPDCHLTKARGCQKCGGVYRKSTKEFIEEAKLFHGGRYTYGNTIYVKAHEPVSITCSLHGDFMQSPTNHLTGKGCPQCSICRPSTGLYLLKYSADIYKIGVTRDIKQRVSMLANSYGRSLQVIKFVECADPRYHEKILLQRYTKIDLGTDRFEGFTELRILTPEQVQEIVIYMEKLC